MVFSINSGRNINQGIICSTSSTSVTSTSSTARMKLFLVTLCVALSSAARLDNTYLPPGSARTAGGSGNFLAAPRGGPGFGGGAHGGHGGLGGGSGFGGGAHGGLGGSGSGFGGRTAGFGGPGAGFGGGAGSGFGGKGAGFGSDSGFGAGSGFGGHAGGAVNRPFPAAPAGPAPVYGAPGAQGQFRSGAGHSGPQIPILRYNNENLGDGSYRYEYATGNGIQAQEAGQLKNAGSQQESNDVHGSFAYTGDDGNQYSVSYVADENGFQPQGAHLPTPPPIPEAILRSLEQNARYPQSGGDDAGQYRGDAGQYSGAGGQYSGAGGAGQYHGGAPGAGGAGQYHGGAPGASGAGQYHGGASQFNRGAPGAFGNAAASRQYLTPRKPSFSPSTGYNY